MRKLLFLSSIVAILLLGVAVSEVSAQKTRSIVLKWGKGEAGRAVAGKAKASISGDAFVDFKFRINEGRGVDIGLFPMPEDAPVTFDIIDPNGKVLFQNIGDFLDELNDPGVYTVRVYMVKESASVKRPPKASFTVTVFMYVP
jgi:hypothetical protein